jgi:RimJ/RimL family protein N-acetyltransferase
MKDFSVFRFDANKKISISVGDGHLSVDGEKINFKAEVEKVWIESKNLPALSLISALETLLAINPESQTIYIEGNQLINQSTLTRNEFFQLPGIWSQTPYTSLTPERWIESNNVTHPLRPAFNPAQALYSRYIPKLDKTLTFRVIEHDRDLEIFHFWHNLPRVSHFWELNKSKEELSQYLKKGLTDPHQMPCLVSLDDHPIGYFEFYWVKEDRLGPYYDSEDYDRGFHFLIGDSQSLGFANTDAVLKSTCHFLFLSDPRTRKIMAEPRADNSKILRYVETFSAWRKVKEFDFPHKRAALLECSREKFFSRNFL